MHVGVYLPNQGPFADVRILAGLARDAEANGFDGFFIWDAIVPIVEHSNEVRDALEGSKDVADAFVALTAVAAATERIRFGTLVTPVAKLRPEVLASQAATLDRFSGGRLILGVGLGNPVEQFSAFGFPTDARTRAAMTDEFLDVMTSLWSGAEVTHAGEHYAAVDISLSPKPFQSPRIPIWIGADSGNRAPRRRAARWDGFAPASDTWPDGVLTPETYKEIGADIDTHRSGRDPYDLILIGNVDATLPTMESLPAYEAAGVTWLLIQALSLATARSVIGRRPPTLQ